MMKPKQVVHAFLLLLAPMAAFAHPGHADGMPIAHAISHSIHYLVAFIAVGIWTAQRVQRIRRSRVID